MKKFYFLYLLLVINIGVSGYAIWQNNNTSKSITYSSYDIERIENKLDEVDKRTKNIHDLTTSIYLKVDR